MFDSNWRAAWMSLGSHGNSTLETVLFMDLRSEHFFICCQTQQYFNTSLRSVNLCCFLCCRRLTLRSKMQLDVTTSAQPFSWTSSCLSASTWPLWGESPNQNIDTLLSLCALLHQGLYVNPVLNKMSQLVRCVSRSCLFKRLRDACKFKLVEQVAGWFITSPETSVCKDR